MTRRTHYSRQPMGPLYALEQPDRLREYGKPKGLWYSVDGGWEEWCESEMFEWMKGGILYAVTLGSENLLRITTLAEFDAFHTRYRRLVEWSAPTPFRSFGIDWQAVAREFDGIEIAPYQYERRLNFETSWYYSWDCASGCIWRPKGTTVELVRDDRTEPAGTAAVP